jgi:hypothetical protein
MSQSRRFRVPVLLIAALAALLAFAGPAAAETLTGEITSTAGPGTEPEAEITAAKASYEKTSGAASFVVTTKAEPKELVGGSPSNFSVEGALFNATTGCNLGALEGDSGVSFPAFEILGTYSDRKAEAAVINNSVTETKLGPATMSVAGVTTNLSATYSQVAGQAFNCAFVFSGEGGTPLVFPISGPPAAPAPPAPPAAAPPAPAPAALSIAKSKPLKLKAGKAKTIKIKVTNTGGTATTPGSLRVKAPAGVIVKPERQKLPVLLPGASWTLSIRVQLTAKAKKSSTIALTGTAPGTSAKGSLVLKRASGAKG